jgi:hypothetical protein
MKQDINSKSGDWFLSSANYLSWRDDFSETSKPLWCPGLPGAGKTVMTSNIVENLRHTQLQFKESHLSGLAYLYLGQKSAGEPDRSPGALLRGLLKQLVYDFPAMPRDIEDLYDTHIQNETSPRDEHVLSILRAVCARQKSVHIMVDALDEYHETDRNVLIRLLLSIQRSIPLKFKLLFTSRLIDIITTELKGCDRMDISAHDDDITAFVQHQLTLPNNERLADLVKSNAGLLGTICSTIIRESANMSVANLRPASRHALYLDPKPMLTAPVS